jgi:subtilisin-like proprotein convertase family protein
MEALAARQRIVSLLGVLLAFPLSCYGVSVHTYGGQCDLPIPADTEDTRGWMHDAVVEVPDHLTICDVDVRISLTHTKAFDLRIFLQSPAGRRICLNTYNPFSEYFEGENYTQTVFDDEAEIPINQSQPPFTGRFRPREPYRLAAFDGEDCFGPWRLQIFDAYYMDTGSLNSFELIITRPIVPPTVATLAAANVQGNNATLRGLIKDDGGQPCQYRFSYWTWGYYCCTGWSDDGDSKTIGQGFYTDLADLGLGTYYFSAQAKNSAGEGSWADAQAFTVRGSTVRRFTGSGSGTKNDPYIIRNVYELQQIDRDLTACYELANDIDASDTNNWNSSYGFTPLGRYTAPFEGVFDGRGHVIIDLCVNRTFLLCVGLFGCTGKTSEIRNVGLNNVTATGYACVGGLTGFNGGVIESCYASGNVNGDTQVGGLVGTNYGWITNCYSTAGVSGGDPCESGDFIAGLVGRSPDGILNNCFSTGRLTGKDCQGLVGICGGECAACFWDIETSGQATSACGTGRTTAEMQTWATFDAAGWDSRTTWAICEGMDYPKLAWQIRPGDEFCPGGVDMVDFALFAARWKAGKSDSSGDGSDTADFNQSGTVNATDLEILTGSWLTSNGN